MTIDNFFKNLHPSFKFYSLFFVFSLFVSVSAFFHVFLNKKMKNSRLIIGGQKKVFAPILIIGGACPGCPQSLRLSLEYCISYSSAVASGYISTILVLILGQVYLIVIVFFLDLLYFHLFCAHFTHIFSKNVVRELQDRSIFE